jgi:hypothetical protein
MHARVLFNLGVSRLLSGVARIVQHPKEYKVYWVHLLWSLFMFLYLIHFWWWEYRLQRIPQWTFALFFYLDVRGCSISAVRAVVPGRDGRL